MNLKQGVVYGNRICSLSTNGHQDLTPNEKGRVSSLFTLAIGVMVREDTKKKWRGPR
jgi:hypothetical protein